MTEPQPRPEAEPKVVDLFVVGVDLSFNKFGQLNTYDMGQPKGPSEVTTMQGVYLFGWFEGTGFKGLPLLVPFPMSKGMGVAKADAANQEMMKILPPEFAKINRVSVDILRFPLLQDSAELL